MICVVSLMYTLDVTQVHMGVHIYIYIHRYTHTCLCKHAHTHTCMHVVLNANYIP